MKHSNWIRRDNYQAPQSMLNDMNDLHDECSMLRNLQPIVKVMTLLKHLILFASNSKFSTSSKILLYVSCLYLFLKSSCKSRYDSFTSKTNLLSMAPLLFSWLGRSHVIFCSINILVLLKVYMKRKGIKNQILFQQTFLSFS